MLLLQSPTSVAATSMLMCVPNQDMLQDVVMVEWLKLRVLLNFAGRYDA